MVAKTKAKPATVAEQAAGDESKDDVLQLKYEYLEDMAFLLGNPKLHDDPRIRKSIIDSGFRDPVAWDRSAGALVEGNGRLGVLKAMRDEGLPPPRGILVDGQGRWKLPVLFGVDAPTLQRAQKYAIDHNNTVAFGGGFSVDQVAQMYDPSALLDMLEGMEVEDLPSSLLTEDDMQRFLAAAGAEIVDETGEPELNTGGGGSSGSKNSSDHGGGQTVPGGGNNGGITNLGDEPPASSVRMLQLFLNQDTHPKMMHMLEELMPHYNAQNPTDCIFSIVEATYRAHQASGTEDDI